MAEPYTLADYRLISSKSDEIHVDLLESNDNRWKIISPWQKPIEFHGMYMLITVFGDVILSGNIPGSDITSKRFPGTNVVTFLNIVMSPYIEK